MPWPADSLPTDLKYALAGANENMRRAGNKVNGKRPHLTAQPDKDAFISATLIVARVHAAIAAHYITRAEAAKTVFGIAPDN